VLHDLRPVSHDPGVPHRSTGEFKVHPAHTGTMPLFQPVVRIGRATHYAQSHRNAAPNFDDILREGKSLSQPSNGMC